MVYRLVIPHQVADPEPVKVIRVREIFCAGYPRFRVPVAVKILVVVMENRVVLLCHGALDEALRVLGFRRTEYAAV